MNMTYHAQLRKQQRGISDLLISFLYQYGNEENINGAKRYSFDHKQKKRLIKEIKKLKENVEKNIYLVLSKEQELVITVAHKIKN